jgi:hypothetical protein
MSTILDLQRLSPVSSTVDFNALLASSASTVCKEQYGNEGKCFEMD